MARPDPGVGRAGQGRIEPLGGQRGEPGPLVGEGAEVRARTGHRRALAVGDDQLQGGPGGGQVGHGRDGPGIGAHHAPCQLGVGHLRIGHERLGPQRHEPGLDLAVEVAQVGEGHRLGDVDAEGLDRCGIGLALGQLEPHEPGQRGVLEAGQGVLERRRRRGHRRPRAGRGWKALVDQAPGLGQVRAMERRRCTQHRPELVDHREVGHLLVGDLEHLAGEPPGDRLAGGIEALVARSPQRERGEQVLQQHDVLDLGRQAEGVDELGAGRDRRWRVERRNGVRVGHQRDQARETRRAAVRRCRRPRSRLRWRRPSRPARTVAGPGRTFARS